jgi:hypothetical protein
MGKVIPDMSISLDGFTVEPNDGSKNGLGNGGDIAAGSNRDDIDVRLRVIKS